MKQNPGKEEKKRLPPEKENLFLVVTTCQNLAEAEKLGREMVDKKLAACVNIVPGVRSFYRWEGRVQEDQECLLLLKTTLEKKESLLRKLEEKHSYEVPELLVVDVAWCNPSYVDWAKNVTEM